MKKFLLNASIFSALLTGSILAVFFIADGRSDSYYTRFTTGTQHSLVIGTSRAAQGINPQVLDEIIYKNNEHHFFNYSFSLFDSPFGPAYYKSITKKLNPVVTDGIFIIAVDPWSVCSKNERRFVSGSSARRLTAISGKKLDNSDAGLSGVPPCANIQRASDFSAPKKSSSRRNKVSGESTGRSRSDFRNW